MLRVSPHAFHPDRSNYDVPAHPVRSRPGGDADTATPTGIVQPAEGLNFRNEAL